MCGARVTSFGTVGCLFLLVLLGVLLLVQASLLIAIAVLLALVLVQWLRRIHKTLSPDSPDQVRYAGPISHRLRLAGRLGLLAVVGLLGCVGLAVLVDKTAHGCVDTHTVAHARSPDGAYEAEAIFGICGAIMGGDPFSVVTIRHGWDRLGFFKDDLIWVYDDETTTLAWTDSRTLVVSYRTPPVVAAAVPSRTSWDDVRIVYEAHD
jgi:hypothetical protein